MGKIILETYIKYSDIQLVDTTVAKNLKLNFTTAKYNLFQMVVFFSIHKVVLNYVSSLKDLEKE